jgi:hypothetical protein
MMRDLTVKHPLAVSAAYVSFSDGNMWNELGWRWPGAVSKPAAGAPEADGQGRPIDR